MIRTTLSFCALFGTLIVVSKLLHDTNRPQPVPAKSAIRSERRIESPRPSEPETPITREVSTTQPEVSPPERETTLILPALPAASAGIELALPVQLTAFAESATEGEIENEVEKEVAVESLRPQQPEATKSPAAAKIDDEDLANAPPPPPTKTTPPAAPPAEAPQAEEKAASEIVITEELGELRDKLRAALAYYYFRPENVAIRSPWGAMHAMIAYGVDSELIVGTKRVNAIGYLCYNGVCNGLQLFYLQDNKLQTRIGPGVQGHPGQFLAMLAQSKVKTDFPMLVEGKQLTVAELIEHEKITCRPRTELTFKLISFTHYLKSDEKWKSNDGQDWDIPRVIKEELAQPIVGAACGGTHRMTGFSYALRKREARGEPFTGQWLRAKKFVEDYHEYAFKLQNPDGSFSTDWFAGRADFGPVSKRLETTGHITEWLAYSLNKEQLVEPRMLKSVSYLANLLLENRNEKWGIGPLGHGLHALAMYDERIFGGKPGTRAIELAEVKKQIEVAKAQKEVQKEGEKAKTIQR